MENSWAAASALNPQTAYGGDVITRIDYCRGNPEGISVLRSVLIGQLELMLDEVLGKGRSREQVYLMTAAGNTTMLHILAGVNPLSLAVAPFRPTFLKSLVVEGERSGLPIARRGRACLFAGRGGLCRRGYYLRPHGNRLPVLLRQHLIR